MKSEFPQGPFKDALGKPLIAPMHDPNAFIDDDPAKTPYVVYGSKDGGRYHIVRHKEDMISLAEKPKPIVINGELWEKSPPWQDKITCLNTTLRII